MANMVNAAGVNSGRAAIFDLDGTLLDSMGVWDAVEDVYKRQHHGLFVEPCHVRHLLGFRSGWLQDVYKRQRYDTHHLFG